MHKPAPRSVLLESRPRESWLDALRVVAAVQMVFGHTIDAVLASSLRHGAIYETWRAWRGTTAIAFLLIAGVSFYLSTLPALPAHLSSKQAIWSRYRRGIQLI